MLPLAANVPALGSKRSTLGERRRCHRSPCDEHLPFGNNVAVCNSLATVMLAVAVNVSAAGSYSSVIESFPPPTMRTFPFPSKVAVCLFLAVVMLSMATNVPIPEMYRSAVPNRSPPVMSTSPLFNSVAVWSLLATAVLPAV